MKRRTQKYSLLIGHSIDSHSKQHEVSCKWAKHKSLIGNAAPQLLDQSVGPPSSEEPREETLGVTP